MLGAFQEGTTGSSPPEQRGIARSLSALFRIEKKRENGRNVWPARSDSRAIDLARYFH
jgi:hypothetical protein